MMNQAQVLRPHFGLHLKEKDDGRTHVCFETLWRRSWFWFWELIDEKRRAESSKQHKVLVPISAGLLFRPEKWRVKGRRNRKNRHDLLQRRFVRSAKYDISSWGRCSYDILDQLQRKRWWLWNPTFGNPSGVERFSDLYLQIILG